MRVSIDARPKSLTPAEAVNLLGGGPYDTLIVHVNGEDVTGCVMADDVAGQVEVYAKNDEGKLILSGDQAVTRVLDGRVVFSVRMEQR